MTIKRRELTGGGRRGRIGECGRGKRENEGRGGEKRCITGNNQCREGGSYGRNGAVRRGS